MAILPDAATAGLAAAVVFLVTLGVLVVFVESISRRTLSVLLTLLLVVAAGLAVLGELGLGLIVAGVPAALVANGIFEWLTTR